MTTVGDTRLPALLPSTRDVERVLEAPGALHTAFQPIVDIHAGHIAGHEALSRFTARELYGPLDWFTAARRAGLGVALETKACIAALRALDRIPAGQYISINLSPEAIMSEEIRSLLDGVDPARVILEVTEEPDTPDLPRQTEHIDVLRRSGIRLAVDDIGAGYSSIFRVLDLCPDFLKIDRGLVQGCATDPMRRYVLEVMVSLAEKQGGEVVAEGVEHADDLRIVQEIGIRYVQGYLLGRPSPHPAGLTEDHRDQLRAIKGMQPGVERDSAVRIAPFRYLGDPRLEHN